MQNLQTFHCRSCLPLLDTKRTFYTQICSSIRVKNWFPQSTPGWTEQRKVKKIMPKIKLIAPWTGCTCCSKSWSHPRSVSRYLQVTKTCHGDTRASLGINNRRQCVGQKFKEFMSLLMLLQFLMMLTIRGVSHSGKKGRTRERGKKASNILKQNQGDVSQKKNKSLFLSNFTYLGSWRQWVLVTHF